MLDRLPPLAAEIAARPIPLTISFPVASENILSKPKALEIPPEYILKPIEAIVGNGFLITLLTMLMPNLATLLTTLNAPLTTPPIYFTSISNS